MIFVVEMTQVGCLRNSQTTLCLYKEQRELISGIGKEHNKTHRSRSNPQSQVKGSCFGVIILREPAAMLPAVVRASLQTWGWCRSCEEGTQIDVSLGKGSASISLSSHRYCFSPWANCLKLLVDL